MRRILIVDDEAPLRAALERYLLRCGFEVVQAGSGEEAIGALQRQKVSCVLLDVGLPDASGIDLVPRLLTIEPTLAILMLTGVTDVSAAALCMQRGAFDYLTKPMELNELGGAIQRAMERRDQLIQQETADRSVKDEMAALVAEVHRQKARFERLAVATLESLVYLMEAKSSYLAGHSARVAQVAASLAAQLKRSDEDIEAVRLAGRLHDIGKICIEDGVLSKEGPLSPEEFDQIRRHVTVGAQILAPIPHLATVSSFVRGHHEHWDGRGYPDGLAGKAIPWGARLVGAAEIYDALTTSRPYQRRMQSHEAIDRMGHLVGTVIDAEVFEAMAAVVESHSALVFIEDGREKTYGAGIPLDTLNPVVLPGEQPPLQDQPR